MVKSFVALAIPAALHPMPAAAMLPLRANEAGQKESVQSAPGTNLSGFFIDCAVSGTGTFKKDGPNIILTGDLTQTMYGTMDGCWAGSEIDIVYKDNSGTFSGSGIFTGFVNGRYGTLVMSYDGLFQPVGPALAHWVLDQGTGGLANLYGEGTWTGDFIDPVETLCTGDPAGCDSMFEATYFGYLKPLN